MSTSNSGPESLELPIQFMSRNDDRDNPVPMMSHVRLILTQNLDCSQNTYERFENTVFMNYIYFYVDVILYQRQFIYNLILFGQFSDNYLPPMFDILFFK